MKDIQDSIRDHQRGSIGEGDTLHKIRPCEVEAFEKARDATMALLDATNVMGTKDAVQAGIVQGILRTHRHLQSQGIFAILTALGEFGRSGCMTDARNEAAKETCKLLVTALRERIYWQD